MLGHAQQRAVRAEPVGERIGVGEESPFRRGGDSWKIAERAACGFHPGAPAPASIRDGMQLDAACKTSHVQVAQRRACAKKRTAQIPVFVSRVEIKLQSTSGVVENGGRKSREGDRKSVVL